MKPSIVLSGLALSLSIHSSHAASSYVLDTVMWGSTFFDAFNFVTVDPNNGFVTYLTRAAAQAANLIYAAEGAAVRISADSTTTLSPTGPGRKSVRIESTKSWTHGLFVFNLAQMPAPSCGIWPALWTLGAGTWPGNGEIDVIEGISLNRNNLMSLHVGSTCSVPAGTVGKTQLGSWVGTNCDVYETSNAGCGVNGATVDTYGNGLNNAGGGLMVMEWTSGFVKIWWYTRASIPADLAAGKPDQTKRGTPQGQWLSGQGCTLDNEIRSQRIVINTNFCGDWAGNQGIWSGTTACSSKAATCADYVAAHPGDYFNAKWLINSIKVYTLQTTSKRSETSVRRGIPDPTLVFEEQIRNGTIVPGDDEISSAGAKEDVVELRDEVFESSKSQSQSQSHLRRHAPRYRSGKTG